MKQLHKKLAMSAFVAGSFLMSNAQTGIHFDGVDDYIQGHVIPVTATNPRTVEVWIRTTKNSEGNQSVISDWGKNNAGNRFTFNIRDNNALRLEVGAGAVNAVTAVNDGVWHHVAVVFESFTSTEHSVKFYVDGNLDAEATLSKYAYILSTSDDLRIGDKITGGKNFEGDMDEFRIWNRVLTQEEIQSRMYTKLCGDEAGLVAYYPFSVGTPNGDNTGVVDAIDESPTGDLGTLTNFALTGTTSNWVIGHSVLSLDGTTLTATQENDEDTTPAELLATYQWVDCDNGNATIEGATERTFTPESSGNYAVEITVAGCVTTSECMEVDINALSIEDNLMDSLKVYPNPTSGNLNVALNGVYQTVEAQLVSITGKVVGQYQFSNTNEFQIELNQFNSGVYFLNLKADQLDAVTIKVVKL